MEDVRSIEELERDLAVLREAGPGGVQPGLEQLLGRVDGAVARLSDTVGDSVSLSSQLARVDENVVVARMALQARDEEHAIFHARRGLELLRDLEGELLEETRRIDRARNRRDFVNG